MNERSCSFSVTVLMDKQRLKRRPREERRPHSRRTRENSADASMNNAPIKEDLS
jgi:hypothetical protein